MNRFPRPLVIRYLSDDQQITTASSAGYWFPGRWLGGASMILGPLLLLTGILLRIQFPFFFTHQLAAYHEYPTLIAASYSCFLAGNILLWPAILTMARLIGEKRPALALWAGTFVMLGLFARTFHAGIDHLVFQLVRMHGVASATRDVAGSYGSFHVVSALNVCILFGWILLAIGAYLSCTLGLVRSIALASMSALMMGVLKGSSLMSLISAVGLCLALLPLGISLMLKPPRPSLITFLFWILLGASFITAAAYVGQLG